MKYLILSFLFVFNCYGQKEDEMPNDPHEVMKIAIDKAMFKKADFLAMVGVMESSKQLSSDQAKQLREGINKMSEAQFNQLLKDKAMGLLNGNSQTSANHAKSKQEGLNPQLIINELLVKVQKDAIK
jgi:hypothetical protein